jgi:DNA-binding ferritin-like protein (Dps family)
MNAIYDVWRFIDHADDSVEQAKLERLAANIRADMKPSDFIQEIEESASFDTDCNKAIQMLFLGGDAATCAKVLSDYADAWLDRQSMKLAQSYSRC